MTTIQWTDRTWTPELVTRFWLSVDRRGVEECWPWLAGLFTNGYGQFRVGLRKVKAHRAALELTRGQLAPGLIACHHCDNRVCCNPAHLYAGSQADNARDRVERGHQARLLGAENPGAKLAAAEIEQVRSLARSRALTYREIGSAYGLHYNSVGRIVRGERWA